MVVKKFGLLLINLSLVSGFKSFHDVSREINDENNLSKCVAEIAKQTAIEPFADVVLVNINDAIGKAVHDLPGLRCITRNSLWYNDTVPMDVYVIPSTDYGDFTTKIDAVKIDSYFNPRAKFIVTINDLDRPSDEIADLLISNNIFNVTILIRNEEDYGIYAFNPELDSCNRPQTLSYLFNCSGFSGTKKVFPIIMPVKPKGCKIKLISHMLWPYINFNETGNMGLEQHLLNVLEEVEGIATELVRYKEDEKFGDVLDNFTSTGMLQEIQRNNVEGAIGGYYVTYNRNRIFDFTYPYMVDHMKIVINAASVLTMWDAVYQQVSYYFFISVIITFVLFSIAAILSESFRKRDRDIIQEIMIVFGSMVGNINFVYLRPGFRCRFIVLNMLFFAIILSAVIQASLLTVTLHPKREQQITDAGFILKMFAPVKTFGVINTHSDHSECDTILACLIKLKQHKHQKKYAFATDELYDHYLWELIDEYGVNELYKLRDPVGTILQAVYFRRGSQILPSFTKITRGLRNGGIISGYTKFIMFQKMIRRRYRAKETNKGQLKDLSIAFIIIAVGYCLSTTVFIFEFLGSIKYFRS